MTRCEWCSGRGWRCPPNVPDWVLCCGVCDGTGVLGADKRSPGGADKRQLTIDDAITRGRR